MRILVINGPNLNLLGRREPALYGRESYPQLIEYIHQQATQLGLECDCLQSNHEGALIDAIQEALDRYQGIVINPAAYTHTSIAIADALKAVALPAVEVHLTAIAQREPYRRHSYTAEACLRQISGQGFAGYGQALAFLQQYLAQQSKEQL